MSIAHHEPLDAPRGQFARRNYTVREVAQILGVSTSHVYRMIDSGMIDAKRHPSAPGKRGPWRIPVLALGEYLSRKESEAY